MSDELAEFLAESIYGSQTRQPLVKLTLEGVSVTVDVATARKIGADIISASHAADVDAFLVEFLQEKLGADIGAAAAILVEFRDWRIFKGQTDL